MRTAFFTSTGRTGTDFFTTLFNEAVENAWSIHEPKPAFRRRAKKNINGQFGVFDIAYFKLPRMWEHRKHKEEWYVETNYHLFAYIPVIRKAFPDALVFHIVRDGRDVVTSWLNRYRYITNEHITPFDTGDKEAQKEWERWNPLQKLSWYWKTVNNHAFQQNPDLLIRFEDIFRQKGGKEIWKILSQFENIEYSQEKAEKLLKQPVNKNNQEFFPKYREWPKKWKDQFWEIAGKEMAWFGYGR